MAVSQVGTGDSEEWSNQSGAKVLTADSQTAGDIAFVIVSAFEVSSTSFSLTGFTSAGEISFNGNTAQMFYRQLVGSDGASYSISASGFVFGTATLMTLRGNGALTFVSSTTGTGTTGTTCTAPDVAGTSGQVLVCPMFTSDPTTMTTPTDMTAGTVGLQTSNTNRFFWQALTADVGTKASTLGTSRDNIALSILLNDAGAGGGATIYTRRPLDSPIFTSRILS
jgi:hypothetical protein